MPEFEIWYSETYTYKAWFSADSKEQAIEVLEAVQQGDLDLESDLTGFDRKDKGYELDLDPLSVEEI
jgi:hypothetical protein